ncbi:MAG: FAD:protein FMN transferase [Candidatus Cyclobacteriaceae bacterium M3_2C_046]
MNRQAIKSSIFSLLLLIFLVVIWTVRNEGGDDIYQPANRMTLNGATMGTTYSIKYLDWDRNNFKTAIDSLLILFNQSVSTYIPDSEISFFNQGDTLFFKLPYFLPILETSREVYQRTEGAFDPTIMPLVNAWGFGPDQQDLPDSVKIDSLRLLVGLDKVFFTEEYVTKADPNMQLDFSAVAKGYGVDVVAEFLERQGIENYMVEIGGEVRCKGKNETGGYWKIGIDNPIPMENGKWLQAIIQVKNRSVATSGNYRNFFTKEGKTYGHTLDPATGYPIQREILSASVLADHCITADAFATAFMVMGLEQAQHILKENPDLDAYLIYKVDEENLDVYATSGMDELLVE